jgi:hypothetical protein
MSDKSETPKPADRKMQPAHVKVRVLHPLGEDGHIYAKGEIAQFPADRVKALGKLVEPAPDNAQK